jgi:hypothetical protein
MYLILYLIDSEEEDAINHRKHKQVLDNDIIKYKQIIERCENKISTQNQEFQSIQKQCAATEARLNTLKEENLEIKRIVIHKNSEVGEYSSKSLCIYLSIYLTNISMYLYLYVSNALCVYKDLHQKIYY